MSVLGIFKTKYVQKFHKNITKILGKYMFVEYSWNIPMIYSQNNRKKFAMKFRVIFPNSVPRILNIGIFPDCSMKVLQMLHVFFLSGSRNTKWIRLLLIFVERL